ncbi:hypothetical protein JW964_27760 [candidate division KSB1 bacterium]|nr:hypothetical protein [candidate division KSB1 bacterium]
MKIDLAQAEYQTLVEMVELANWVLFSTTTGEEPEKQKYHELEQKIFSQAEKFDLGRIMLFEKECNEYYPTPEFESESQIGEFIEEFETNIFWEELIDRLTLQDLLNKHGLEKLQNLPVDERIKIEEPIREKYEKEFKENGLERVTIMK